MIDNKSVVAVIVTYNRKELLLENIKMIESQSYQVDKIIIIDNHGSDNSEDFIKKNNVDLLNKVKYIYLDENIGGAGGFYYGTKIAYEDGYDWTILMDDDGRPFDKKTFYNLIVKIDDLNLSSNSPVMLNSLVIENENCLTFGLVGKYTRKEVLELGKNDIVLNNINPFNGTLISRKLIEQIGYPNKDFFIKGDEADYLSRAMKANSFVATVVNSLYYHPKVNNLKKITLWNKTIEIFIEKPWKEYYQMRNYTYMWNRDKKYIKILKMLLKRIYCVLVCKCEKLYTLKMIFKGLKDGFMKKLGITVLP